ncbi:hypothetical protein [Porticoccus sp.]
MKLFGYDRVCSPFLAVCTGVLLSLGAVLFLAAEQRAGVASGIAPESSTEPGAEVVSSPIQNDGKTGVADHLSPPDDWSEPSIALPGGSAQTRLGCDGFAEKPLREIPSGGIVKWTDEQGITHYEDYHGEGPPEGLEVVTRFPDTKEYFFLSIESDYGVLPTNFRTAIAAKAVWIYEYYRALLDERFLSRARVNLVVHRNKAGYEAIRSQYVGAGAEDVPGFYIVSGNRAQILYQDNDEQTLKVMVHEVVHVINNQLFGQMPRWLNEGLATYMESLDRDEQRPASATERLRLIKRQVGLPLLDRVSVRQILFSENLPWGPRERIIYYPFSQLLTTYLLQPENRAFSRLFFSYLAAHKCETPDVADYINAHYPGGIDGLSAGFVRWLAR